MLVKLGPPAMKYHAVNNNRDEESSIDRVVATNDASGLKPSGGSGADIPTMKTRKTLMRIGAWNVRTLYQSGKFDNLLIEMESLKTDILGISETRWTESGSIRRRNYTIIIPQEDKNMNTELVSH
ncbi:craniofacial development protein 2 [Elysia marginata]|uniref:Craniofacial development protein 2 n=1 Tax=Elysia marginata TaxID=1093978 RepID=A0AAV4HNE4_9GAST|nr:craniofacial development protein 2 [Elysia marginata]